MATSYKGKYDLQILFCKAFKGLRMQYKCKYKRGVHQDGDFGKEGSDDEVETACNGSTKKKYSLINSFLFTFQILMKVHVPYINDGRREREFLYYKNAITGITKGMINITMHYLV